jgi:SAM-dependent methyltransferase
MQAYGRVFARVYNAMWTGFAQQVAPCIMEFYLGTPVGQTNSSLLDLCCGTGQLMCYFLADGFQTVGLDLSEHMLAHARRNAAPYLASGQARFVQGDAADFQLNEQFGLVVSTFDALNHLPSAEALDRCFRCVFPVLAEGGYFIFDLNTRAGLARWNNITIQEGEDALIVIHGIYDRENGRALTRISGFARARDDLYERFEETVFNTAFDMAQVREMLLAAGWRGVHFARLQELATPLDEPEEEGRVFIVAQK